MQNQSGVEGVIKRRDLVNIWLTFTPRKIKVMKQSETSTFHAKSDCWEISGVKRSQSVKTDLAGRSVIYHKLRERSEKELMARIEHNLSRIKSIISNLLAETVSEVSICRLYRIGENVGSESNQKNRLLIVNFALAEERNLILRNSHKLTRSGIYIRENFSLD